MTPDNEAKATERPWTVDGQDIMSGEHEIALMTDTNFNWKANAAFIVKAVNAHEELVEALKAMFKHFGTLEDNQFMNRECVKACKLARKALALAEGRPE